jgi:hypothetical protein
VAFWRQVRLGSACWEWTGQRNAKGYGLVAPSKRGRSRLAHRVAWAAERGPLPDGLNVLHRCDNPPCVRPDHLFLGTQRENMRDRDAKGRQAQGEAVGRSRLTRAAVAEIRDRYAAGGVTLRSLAAEYGTTFQNIQYVVRGRTWKRAA